MMTVRQLLFVAYWLYGAVATMAAYLALLLIVDDGNYGAAAGLGCFSAAAGWMVAWLYKRIKREAES